MKLQPWLTETWHSLARRLERNELPHALLFTGAPGLGKRALANALAAAALCEKRDGDGYACTECRACRLVSAGSHPDRAWVTFELRDDGKPRTEIVIEQIRNLSQRLSLSSQFGGLQLALIDPADKMNVSTANALLKTLEEPSSDTVILLISDQPSRLPATIRSRCQRIEARFPDFTEGRDWMISQGVAAGLAEQALAATLGNPGQALEALREGILELRKSCTKDLQALSNQHGNALAIAESWAADRPSERLWHAAVVVRDEARQLASGERGILGLTGAIEIPKLVAWFTAANRSRDLLATQVRAELVLLDLLHTWQTPRRP